MTTKSYLLLFVALTWTVVVSSNDATAANASSAGTSIRITLDEAVRSAVSNNPGLQAVRHLAEARQSDASGVSRSRLGTLSAIASGNRYKDSQILRPIASELLAGGFSALPFDDTQFHYGLTYELPLYLGGALNARVNLAHDDARIAQQELSGTRWQTEFNAVSLYSSLVALGGAREAQEAFVRSLETVEAHVQLMFDQGKRPRVDLLKIQEQLADARAGLSQVKAQQTRANTLLVALLDMPEGTKLATEDLGELPELQLERSAIVNRLDDASSLQMKQLQLQKAEHRKDLARSAFLPHLVAQAGVFGHAAPDVDGPQETWEATLAVQLPLLEGGARIARLQAAKQGKLAAQRALDGTVARQHAELTAAFAAYEAARDEHAATLDRVRAAEEAARIESIRYDEGAGRIEDLLQARARLAAARASKSQSRGAIQIAAAQINSLVEMEVVR